MRVAVYAYRFFARGEFLVAVFDPLFYASRSFACLGFVLLVHVHRCYCLSQFLLLAILVLRDFCRCFLCRDFNVAVITSRGFRVAVLFFADFDCPCFLNVVAFACFRFLDVDIFARHGF